RTTHGGRQARRRATAVRRSGNGIHAPGRPSPHGGAAGPGPNSSIRRGSMGLFSGLTLNTFDDLFVEQLQELYDAEQRLTKALPKMAGAAHSPALKAAFQEHFRQTEGHVTRLEQVFRSLGKSAGSKTCAAMKGLIEEGQEAISASGDPDVKDA